jgi:hypothetical protein
MKIRKLLPIVAASAIVALGVGSMAIPASGAAPLKAPVSHAALNHAAKGKKPFKNYHNNLKRNTKGWCDGTGTQPCDGNFYGTIDNVKSSFTNGGGSNYAVSVPGPNGATKYARATGGGPGFSGYQTTTAGCPVPGNENCTGPYTTWGNPTQPNTFPTSTGFNTSIQIYLDPTWAAAHPGQVVDWDTALGTNTGGFLSDFAFNMCTTAAGGGGFYISFGNGAGGCSTGPTELTQAGWYTFNEQFTSLSGVLVEAGSVLSPSNASVFSNTDNTGDAISGVGGPIYGWLPDEDVNGLPLANVSLTL